MENYDKCTEEILPPLPNEDRDFFLNLIGNPPEPNEALRNDAKEYEGWRKRDSGAENY